MSLSGPTHPPDSCTNLGEYVFQLQNYMTLQACPLFPPGTRTTTQQQSFYDIQINLEKLASRQGFCLKH